MGAALLLVIAVAFGGFAAVSTVVTGGQANSGAGAAPTDQETAPAAGPEATASPSATPTGNGCEQNLVTVTAATDKACLRGGREPAAYPQGDERQQGAV